MKNFCGVVVSLALTWGQATYSMAQAKASASASASASAGASDRQVWFKSAVELEHTIRSWGLQVDIVERSLYFSTLGALYGNTDMAKLQVLLRGPNSGYALALDLVAKWLSEKLLQRQLSAGKGYLFGGSAAPPDRDGCYFSAVAWCDYDDGLELGTYSLTVLPDNDVERKRVMHNIQDIGDFLGITIDNLLLLAGEKLPQQHVPQYILENVFVPQLQAAGGDIPADYRAWRRVVYVLLMSGQFFMRLNVERE